MYEKARVLFAAASKPVGYSARKKDVSARSQDRLLFAAEEGEFSIQHIERFVFHVVKVVRRIEARSRREMNEGIRASCCLAFGQKDMEGVEKPIGWRIIEGRGLQSPLIHSLNLLPAEGVTPLEELCR